MFSRAANKSVRCNLSVTVESDSRAAELLHIHRQSAYLIGRDRLVADIAVDHPSCSKQHAVIQCKLVDLVFFVPPNVDVADRFVQQKDEFGVSTGSVKSVATLRAPSLWLTVCTGRSS